MPFICQHLVAIIKAKNITDAMHTAYNRIAGTNYCFDTFIAGPSKTADKEQSLVLPANGPRTMTAFIVDK